MNKDIETKVPKASFIRWYLDNGIELEWNYTVMYEFSYYNSHVLLKMTATIML